MSHVAKISLIVKDLEALKIAAKELGLEFVEGQKSYRWYGRYMGDYPLPEGISKEELGQCDHALRVPDYLTAYEVGVVRRKDGQGYHLLWDFYQGGYGLQSKIGQNGNLLKQAYAVHAATRAATREGLRVQQQRQADGTVRLVLQR